MKVENDPKVQKYYSDHQLAKSTQENYSYRLQKYCNFIKLGPSEFIQEAIKEEETGIPLKYREINKYFKSYYEHLKRLQYSPKSISITMSVIKSFYGEYKIELPIYLFKTFRNKKIKDSSDVLSKEDILCALKFANVKYQAIILLMVSSGMGISEIINLTVMDFMMGLKGYYYLKNDEIVDISLLREILDGVKMPVAIWKVRRIKTGVTCHI